MSKRSVFFPQHSMGDRKRPKLDVSISDHNFPLSQNNNNRESETDNWGDDNDDEILLLASQACEEAYHSTDLASLPDYSMFVHAPSTSTQIQSQTGSSTSKAEFTFKKPMSNLPSSVTTNLKEKCNRISSPLPGITAKVISKTPVPAFTSSTSDEYVFSDKIFKGQDSWSQLLQFQEENAKLKAENGKLLDKCVTKEGEASILRTQLKSCQAAVDSARMDKVRMQEKVQMEWTEKLSAANSQLQDLKTQLDFKNMEIIGIKEKCKKLESSKVRLTQVTVSANDISMSHRNSSNMTPYKPISAHNRKVKTHSVPVQTEDKCHYMKLHKTHRKETTNLTEILPQILEPSTTQHSILDFNEKLQHHDTTNKCRVFSTFHRIPATPTVRPERPGRVQLSSVYEDLMKIATGDGGAEDSYFNVFNAIKSALSEVQSRLETVSQRLTTAFQKEMDEKYLESASLFLEIGREGLIKGRCLYKDEQEILARRLMGILTWILERPPGADMLRLCEERGPVGSALIDRMQRICSLIDRTSCATLYSGFLLSTVLATECLSTHHQEATIDIMKSILSSRPMSFVIYRVLEIMKDISLQIDFLKTFCPGSNVGNLKLDYDQGVLLYKKDSCYIQVLVKQVENCLKCIESQKLVERAVSVTRNLIILFSNMNTNNASLLQDKSKCECHLVLVQVMAYALRTCAVMMRSLDQGTKVSSGVLPACLCGAAQLARGPAPAREPHHEGHLIEFCEAAREGACREIYGNMLSELSGSLQPAEDSPPSFNTQPWLRSFESFSLTD